MNRLNNGILKKKQAPKYADTLLWFFVKIFKIQLGAPSSAQTKIEPASPEDGAPGPDQIYTLRVFDQGAWKSRRITIGKLGANVANKSSCFRVIYDDLLVIKIPPNPILSVEDYIRAIQSERRIAAHASPDILCIVPSLSAVLSKIPAFQGGEAGRFDEIEKRCLKMISEDSALQQYLKIGESFAFFMSLSKYAFLNQVVEAINTHTSSSIPEISTHLDMLSRYGIPEGGGTDPRGEVFFEMKCLLDEYLNQIQDLAGAYRIDHQIPGARITEWLASHLSKSKIDTTDPGIPKPFFQELQEILDRMTLDNRATIESYISSVAGDAEKRLLDRQNIKKRGLVINMLSLWGSLRNHNLAIRDLKPENIFVVADLVKSDRILSEPDEYSLGLIDLETAVRLSNEPTGKPEQPVRTGTPAYA
ncbi:MAG: hypothetical protein AB1659_09870, partial [Thermodesulfobacteriota bacterium]